MSDKFILDDNGKVVPEPDLIRWATWFENNSDKRVVARTTICDSKVSTVFLGLDYSRFSEFHEATPILWETMVRGGKLDQDCDRCSGTREQAEAMHAKMVQKVEAGESKA